jgi:hypothetical protein
MARCRSKRKNIFSIRMLTTALQPASHKVTRGIKIRQKKKKKKTAVELLVGKSLIKEDCKCHILLELGDILTMNRAICIAFDVTSTIQASDERPD